MRDRMKTTARVYLRDAPTVYLTGEGAFDTATMALDQKHVIRGTTTDGERITIPYQRVVDIVEPDPARKVEVQEGIFYGRRCEVLTLSSAKSRYPSDFDNDAAWPWPDDSIVVMAEDMAAAPGLILTPDAQEVLWINPANEDGVTKRYHRAACCLAEAETLQTQAYADPVSGTLQSIPDVPPVSIKEATGRMMGQADAALAAGDVPRAVQIVSAEYVAAFLTGAPSDVVQVELAEGNIGTVVFDYEPEIEADEIPVRFGGGEHVSHVPVSTIEACRFVNHPEAS